jgi:O-antigen/teichoic acid export membrane protein
MDDTEEQKKTIIRNISWLSISKIIVYLLSIITITLVPRYLGVEGYGQLNFALSFVGLFVILGDLGLNTLSLRELSKNNSLIQKYFSKLFPLKVFLSLVFTLIMGIIILLINKSLIVKQILFLTIIIMVISIFSNFYLTFFQAKQKLQYRSIFEVLNKLFYVLFIFLFIYLNKGVIGITLANILMNIFGLVFLFFSLFKYVKFKINLDIKFIKKQVIRAFPFALGIVFTNLYFHFDKILISFMIDEYAVGLYAIGYTLYVFLFNVLSIFSVTFFPVISIYSFKEKLKSIINKYLYIILLFSTPLALGGIFLAKELIILIFGSVYVPGVVAFRVILVFFLVASINSVLTAILYNHNLEKFVLKYRIIATITNILLNLIIIPIFGIIGAALTTVFSEYIILIGSYIKLSKSVIRINILKILKVPLISSIIMLVAIYIFKNIFHIVIFTNSLNVLIFIVIGAIFYFISLFLLGGIKKEYFNLILNSFRK